MKVLLFLLATLCVVPAFAQSDLPDRGDISELKGKNKVYVSAEGNHIKAVEKELRKTFTLVQKVADADFILEYTTLRVKEVGSLQIDSETGQMDAYIFRDSKKVIVWTDTAYSGFSSEPDSKLSKRFVKAWKSLK